MGQSLSKGLNLGSKTVLMIWNHPGPVFASDRSTIRVAQLENA